MAWCGTAWVTGLLGRRAGASERGDLGEEFSPAGADCRYRAPLVPRLARLTKDTAAEPGAVTEPDASPGPGPPVVTEQDALRVEGAKALHGPAVRGDVGASAAALPRVRDTGPLAVAVDGLADEEEGSVR